MIVEQGQSFWDLVIQATGSVDNAFEMALLNGFSITDDVAIGQTVDAGPITNKRILALFNANHKPATHEAFPFSGELSPIKGGIGYMQIGSTFIVS